MKRFDLIGNRHIRQTAQKGELSSAVIFDGIPGSGKKTAAVYAAAALLCTGEGERPCGVCRSCRQIEAGTHPDMLMFNPEGENIKVADIRELRARSFMAPVQGRDKVFIINRADLMNQESQNALLKVLEEPEATVFILLTENSSALLQTVRSRCRTYAMEALEPERVEKYLAEHFAASGESVTRESITRAAAMCGGSIGMAIELMEQGGGKPAEAAAAFIGALGKGELEIMEACLKASSLARAEYDAFYTQVISGLKELALREPHNAELYVSIYDHIQSQRDKLLGNNASVFALSSELAVFCGGAYRR